MKVLQLMKAKLQKGQEGFTLIELMIVVGIIGILVAIAAPNFARYQSKARQSEAKISLAAVYGGEKSFYSEYSAYVSAFDAVGYAPEGDKRFYGTGWSNTQTAPIQGYTGGFGNNTFARVNFPAAWTTCSTSATGLPAAIAAADSQTFTVAARGQIRNGVNCDVWDIDQDKIIRNSTTNL